MFSKFTLEYTYISLKNSSTVEDNDILDNPPGLPASASSALDYNYPVPILLTPASSSALGHGTGESMPILNVPERGSAQVHSMFNKRKPANGDDVRKASSTSSVSNFKSFRRSKIKKKKTDSASISSEGKVKLQRPCQSSVVRKFFKKLNPIAAICKLCNKEFKSNGNASNLYDDLNRAYAGNLIGEDNTDSSDINPGTSEKKYRLYSQRCGLRA